ncbi:MAG TPA: STAS domain-containing protein [Gemmataceae bacterium]|jgi:anti-sigma B factor antagonist|nr:STAS domain-containing protein [Gemmataceae bacterium]
MKHMVEKIGDVTIVAVNVEELDAASADDFRRDMAPVLKDARKLVLDLDRVQFVDSRGCGVILSCLKQVSAAGGDLKLCRVTKPVHMVFELIRMGSICEIVGTRDEAVQAFQESKKK